MKLTDIRRVVAEKVGKLKLSRVIDLLEWLDHPESSIEPEGFRRLAAPYVIEPGVPVGVMTHQVVEGVERGLIRSLDRKDASEKEELIQQAPVLTDGQLLESITDLAVKLNSKGNKLQLVEERIVDRAFSLTHGNKSAAARLLGIDRKAFERRVRR